MIARNVLLVVALGMLCVATASASTWRYQEEKDKLTDQKTRRASTASDNSFRFSFPYSGVNRGRIDVRLQRDETDVIFGIERGQFVCNDCALLVRFDANPPERYTVSGTSDRSANILFVDRAQDFIDSAMKAKRIRVEFVAYQEGVQVADFSFAKPLTWGSSKNKDSSARVEKSDNAQMAASPPVTLDDLLSRCDAEMDNPVVCKDSMHGCWLMNDGASKAATCEALLNTRRRKN